MLVHFRRVLVFQRVFIDSRPFVAVVNVALMSQGLPVIDPNLVAASGKTLSR